MREAKRSKAGAGGFIQLTILAKHDPEVSRWVAGSPELDVWSSGDDSVQSMDRAKEAIILFLNEADKMGTVWQILREAGIEFHTSNKVQDSLFQRLQYALQRNVVRVPLSFEVPAPAC